MDAVGGAPSCFRRQWVRDGRALAGSGRARGTQTTTLATIGIGSAHWPPMLWRVIFVELQALYFELF